MQVKDKVISKVYEGKPIEGKGCFYDFYLEGGKKKYGLFVGKGKTIPKAGMRVALLEYEEVQDGEYTNNKVKNIVWMGVDAKAETGKRDFADKTSPIWFCLSYAKDIQVAMITQGYYSPENSLEELALETASVAVDMLRFIEHPIELLPKPEPEKPKDLVEQAMEHDSLGEEIPY